MTKQRGLTEDTCAGCGLPFSHVGDRPDFRLTDHRRHVDWEFHTQSCLLRWLGDHFQIRLEIGA